MDLNPAPALSLIPNLAEVYRAKVAALQAALGGEDATAARERIRGLIGEVRLVPSPVDVEAPPRVRAMVRHDGAHPWLVPRRP